jgi:hypothetical protein
VITQDDLQQAIAECQAVRHPTARTCIKLAAFLTIQEHMYGNSQDVLAKGYSMMSDGNQSTISAVTDSEFSRAVDGKPQEDVLLILEDALNSIKFFNPKMYDDIIRRLSDV